MRIRLVAAGLVAAAVVPFAAGCSSSEPVPATGAPSTAADSLPASGSTDAGVTPQFLESLRSGYQEAYNALPLDSTLPYEEYLALFEPLWQQATDAGVTLYRRPVEAIEGFSLTAEDASSPGHALFLEVSAGSASWCVADTEVLPDALTTPKQRNEAATPPKEFAVVDGPCTVLVDDLSQRMLEAEG